MTSSTSGLFAKLQQRTGRYTGLFITLVFVILLAPIAGRIFWGMPLLFSITFSACYQTVHGKTGPVGRHRWFRGFLIFALVTAAARAALSRMEFAQELSTALLWLSAVGVYTWMAVLLVRSIFTSREVNTDVLSGAGALYLLMGLAWANLHETVQLLNPLAYNGVNSANEFADLLYFSFVTLTTLGYGDIVPLSPMARSLTILEAISGILFISIILARLVAIYKTNPSVTR